MTAPDKFDLSNLCAIRYNIFDPDTDSDPEMREIVPGTKDRAWHQGPRSTEHLHAGLIAAIRRAHGKPATGRFGGDEPEGAFWITLCLAPRIQRIPGVNPTDVALVDMWISRKR